MSQSVLAQFHLRHGPATGIGGANQETQSEDSNKSNQGAEHDDSSASVIIGQRRPRSESMETEVQQEEKRCRQFSASLCATRGLPEDAMDDFINLDATDMMITIHADILQLLMQERKSKDQIVIQSENFKDIMKDWMKACLLSPNLTTYVTGLGDQIFAFAKKNIQIFKILDTALEDPELSGKILVLIKDLLTNQWSNMKQKISNHISSRSHVSILAKALASGGGYKMTPVHWARIAFLCDLLVKFDLVVEASAAHTAAQKQNGRSRARQHALLEGNSG